MLQIEKFQCNDSNEAHARERYWYENMNAKLNSQVPNRTRDEYYIQNKDRIKEYYDENKEHLKEYSSIYYDKNKEHLKEYSSKYRDENKEKIAKRNSEIFMCKCGKTYTITNKSHH